MKKYKNYNKKTKNNYVYDWEDFEITIHQIENQINFNQFKTIIAIAKGGLLLGVKLSNLFNLPLKIVYAYSYINKKQKELCVEQFNCIKWESPVLLVDDIVDSGITLQDIKDQLEIWGKKVKTLVLFYKPKSIIKPDFYFQKVLNNTWVEFPWE